MKKLFQFILLGLLMLPVSGVQAQEGFIGEIRLFGGNFAPRNWAYCEGQLISINQNQALFSILGTTYGGDGRTTFALPDLKGVNYKPLPHAQSISKSGGGKVSFTATNRSSKPVEMFWVDFSGQRKLYATIQPGKSLEQVSGANQVWHFIQRGELIEAIQLSSQTKQSYSINSAPVVKYIICMQGIFPSRN